MKPKAKKFRIRRTGGDAAPGPAASHAAQPAARQEPQAPARPQPNPQPQGHPVHPQARAQAQAQAHARAQAAAQQAQAQARPAPQRPMEGQVQSAAETSAATHMDEIRREGLTGRQLRMARRIAQKHGLAPTSDFDAVRLLRERGIDPFQRSTMLELVVPDNAQTRPRTDPQLPQTVPREKNRLPSTQVGPQKSPADRRAEEISRMQRDIARRRRRNLAKLFMRLAFFVFLPTLIVGWYYYYIATPMYATKSEFVIQQAEAAGATGLGGMFAGTQLATNQDSIAVQSFLESRAAMIRLNEDHGFKAHFSGANIDTIQGLDQAATNEEAYKLYKKHVKLGYDPTEGVIKMEVIAADPETSQRFAEALIGYAEEQVDELTQRLREDQMQGARESYEEAEGKRQQARDALLQIQKDVEILDPAGEAGGLMAQITGFETQLQEKRLQLQALLDNRRPNQARVEGTQGDIRRLEAVVAQLREQMTEESGSGISLATKSAELRMAEADFQTRELMLQQALQQMETARIEANRQVRYLSTGVPPIAPDEPTYPQKFENTLLAFLIFSGIYLMLSLTAAVLREQVSS